MEKKIRKLIILFFIISICILFTTTHKVFAAYDELLKNTTRAYFYSEITHGTQTGDCILLENFDENGVRHFGLIDAGLKKDENENAVTSVKDFLQKHNVTNLDFFIITHTHTDHSGDAIAVLDNYDVKTLYMKAFDVEYVSDQKIQTIYEKIIEKAVEKDIKVIGIDYQTLKSSAISPSRSEEFINNTQDAKQSNFLEFDSNNTKFTFGSTQMQIFNWEVFDANGNQLYIKQSSNGEWEYQTIDGISSTREVVSNDNNNSLGVLLTQGNKKAFFAGDINNEDKNEITGKVGDEDRIKDEIGDVDFLKLGHHGNTNSTTNEYINVLKPEYAIITNEIGRAAKEIVTWLDSNNVDYLYNTQDQYEVSATISNDNVYLGVGTENIINRINNNYYYVQQGGKYKDYKKDLYKIEYKEKNVDVKSWEELRTAIENNKNNEISVSDNKYTVFELKANLIPGDNWIADSNITIDSQQKVVLTSENSVTIKRGKELTDKPLFLNNGILSLGNEGMTGNIIIDGNKKEVTSSSALIHVVNGDLYLYNNVTICNNFNKTTELKSENGSTFFYTAFGSAIYARNGNINMFGGEIANNSQKVAISEFKLPLEALKYYDFSTKGAGIYLECASSLNMYGGAINKNVARNESIVRTNRSYSNAKCNRGIRQQCLGVGVYAFRGSKVNLINGKIEGNMAVNDSCLQLSNAKKEGKTTNIYSANSSIYGVGICVEAADLNISENFEISNNSGTQNSKIFIQNNTIVKKSVTSSIRGLNAYIENGVLNISGGKISGGKASNNSTIFSKGSIGSTGSGTVSTTDLGAGINIKNCVSCSIENLNINSCKSDKGAGMYISSTDAKISNSNISQNEALYGAGIYTNDTSLTVDNNTQISDNVAKIAGGGVKVNSNGDFTLNGGNIQNNKTSEGSGGGIQAEGFLTINEGLVASNRAKTDGGGVFCIENQFVNNGGTIQDNIAENGNDLCINIKESPNENEQVNIIDVNPIDICDCQIEGINTSYYTGKEIKPKITITYDNEKLVQGVDFKVSYSNNKEVGEATVKIVGLGKCFGTVYKTFRIINKANIDVNNEYYIVSSYAKNQVLDAKDGKLQTGNNIVINKLNNGNSQKIKLVKNNDGSYMIKNTKINNYIEVLNNKIGKENANLVFRSATKTYSQKWYIGQNSDKTISFYTANGLALEVTDNKNNTNVQINTINNKNTQKFTLKSTSTVNIDTNKYYYIVSSINNKKAIDVYGGMKNDYTNVDIYDLNRTNAQKFKFSKNTDGSYTIINKASNKVIDVGERNISNSSNVCIKTSNKSASQKWYIKNNSDNTISFINVQSGKALDLYAANASNFNNIGVWAWNQTKAQKWILIKE